MTVVTQHIKPSAHTHTPSSYFVNEVSSPSNYTNTGGYTVSHILCRFFLTIVSNLMIAKNSIGRNM
jgi:hypothetical protein